MMVFPIQLRELFDDVNFISNIPAGQKLCVKGRYYTSHTWVGWITRKWEFETSEVTNIFIVNTCTSIVEALTFYNNTIFHPLILDKIRFLRDGILKIKNTYSFDPKISNSLENQILMIDLSLPEKFKIEHGIIADLAKNKEMMELMKLMNFDHPSIQSYRDNNDIRDNQTYTSNPIEIVVEKPENKIPSSIYSGISTTISNSDENSIIFGSFEPSIEKSLNVVNLASSPQIISSNLPNLTTEHLKNHVEAIKRKK